MTIREPVAVSAEVVHVEFELTNLSYPFIGLSLIDDCEVKLEEILPRKAGGYTGFYSIRGADPEQLLIQAATYEGSDARFINREEDGGLLELSLTEKCPAMFLAEHRALPRRVSATAGVGRITAELLAATDEHDIVEAFLAAYPTAELHMHRQQSRHTPLFSHREFDRAVEGLLTERQHECFRLAFVEGYYEWPRETTAQDLAAMLEIAPATYTQHLRAAERKFISLLFN